MHIFIISDIDECELRTYKCSQNAVCKNEVGNYSCICNTGFEMEKNNACTGRQTVKKNFPFLF